MQATAAPGCLAIDASMKITGALAQRIARASIAGEPIKGIARYVSISQPRAGDIDANEAKIITDAGLGLWLVQHPYLATLKAAWMPSGQLGQIDGAWAARNALAAGYPKGCHLGIDLEGVAASASHGAIVDYVNTRVEEHAKLGYPTVLYVGFSVQLSPEELWELPTVHLYWSDWGNRKVANCGFALKQILGNSTLPGIPELPVDIDRIYDEGDELGRHLVWATADAPPTANADA